MQAHTSKAWRKKVLFSDLAHSMHSKHNSTYNRERECMQHYVLILPRSCFGDQLSFPSYILPMLLYLMSQGTCFDPQYLNVQWLYHNGEPTRFLTHKLSLCLDCVPLEKNFIVEIPPLPSQEGPRISNIHSPGMQISMMAEKFLMQKFLPDQLQTVTVPC